jgi:DNA-binding transcriptional regulator of glucitol operon
MTRSNQQEITMSTRPTMLALAMIAALAATGLAPTSASAFGDGSVRFSQRGHFGIAQRLDPYKSFKFQLSVASGRRPAGMQR